MLCALSGEPAKEPVVSPRSGAVFERKLVEAYIATSGKDPITDEPLATQDLVEIKTTVPTISPPRPPAFNSIPTMLAAFQNEWDALALETYTLRKQLNLARQELSEALYQYDAAVRVAGRAIKERDEAQAALLQLSETFAREVAKRDEEAETRVKEADGQENSENVAENGKNMEVNGEESTEVVGSAAGIPVDLLKSARDSLFALHKKQKVSLPVSKTLTVEIKADEPFLTIEEIRSVSSSSDGSQILLASPQKVQILPETTTFDLEGVAATAVVNSSSGLKAIALADGSVVDLRDNTRTNLLLKAVTGIFPHPSEPIFVALTGSNEWALCDDTTIFHRSTLEKNATCADLHVDGVLLGVGTDSGIVEIYDLTSAEKVSSITTQYLQVNKLQFALNGYWLVASSKEGNECVVQIFDLRKNSLLHKIELTSPVDFVLDPSCLVLTTYEKDSRRLLVHLYVKKGKLWVDQVSQIETEELEYLVGESSPQSVQDTQVVKVVGVGRDRVVHYEVSIDT